MGAGPEDLPGLLWEEPPLGRGPGQGPRLQAVRSCPPLLWLRPVSWLHNEPLSVWSLLVLAPNSLWNQAQILETALLKKKHQSPGRDQPELSIHSLEKPLSSHYPHVWIRCTKLTCTNFTSALVIHCVPQLTRNLIKVWDCIWSFSLVYFKKKIHAYVTFKQHKTVYGHATLNRPDPV